MAPDRQLRAVFFVLLSLLIIPFASGQRAPDSPFQFADFIEPDFPFITTTLNAGTLGPMYPARNLAARCVVLQLGNDAYACFDTDLLRVAATWTGEAISLVSMPQVSYHKAGNKTNAIPEILGNPITATGIYPGWQNETPLFSDPRPEGPNPEEMGRGPIDTTHGRWQGISVFENSALLHYEVLGTAITEMITSNVANHQTGITRNIEIAPHARDLTIVLAEFLKPGRIRTSANRLEIHHAGSDTVTVIGTSGNASPRLDMLDERYAVLTLPAASETSTAQITVWKGHRQNRGAFRAMMDVAIPVFPDVSSGAPARWPEPVVNQGRRDANPNALAKDILTLPMPNPWQRNVRASGIDFFPDGRAAISTFEGDVWILSNIDDSLEQLTWKRYASGLCEPMSLSIVDGQIYTFGREGIVRLVDLNGDEEADFYENFSNLPVQSGESREFPLSMHALPQGGFILSKGAALNAGPKTNPPIMEGFRAGGPHSGSILHVSADGRSMKYFATGLREPYAGVHPETGWVTASDQQGNFVPSTPIYFIQQGDYFGVPATAHRNDLPEAVQPLTWVPHQVDRSSAEQVWVTSDRMGPLNGALIHLSYGKPGIYRVYHDDNWQGGISPIPLTFNDPLMKGKVNPQDGQLYLSGFQVWDSDAQGIAGISRIRYTGGHLPLPEQFKAGSQGIHLRFGQKLDPAVATDASNYTVERWKYERSESYGSGHFMPSGEPGHETVKIEAISVTDEGHDVFLHIEDMQEVMQMSVDYRLLSVAGDSINHSVYFTLNVLPDQDLAEAGFSNAITIQATNITPSDNATAAAIGAAPTAEQGQQVYQRMGCVACHSSDGTVEGRSGPTFQGLYGSRRTFNDGSSAIADDVYLKESILEPAAKVVAGKEVEMPSYVGILSDEDISAIILYIKSISGD